MSTPARITLAIGAAALLVAAIFGGLWAAKLVGPGAGQGDNAAFVALTPFQATSTPAVPTSTATAPPAPTQAEAATATQAIVQQATVPADLSEAAGRSPVDRDVTYCAPDGVPLQMDIYRPQT